jgi:hypothetical protein
MIALTSPAYVVSSAVASSTCRLISYLELRIRLRLQTMPSKLAISPLRAHQGHLGIAKATVVEQAQAVGQDKLLGCGFGSHE